MKKLRITELFFIKTAEARHKRYALHIDSLLSAQADSPPTCGVKLPFVRIEHKLAAKNGDCSRLFISAISCCDRTRCVRV